MVKQNNSRAQGTIEYLVIIAVVVVIALVVVALVLNMSDSDATQIISNKNQNLIGKGGISIIDSIISSTGDGVISLQNTLGESLTLKTITPGAENDCEKLLTPGEKYNCYLTDINSACPCSAGQRVTCNFKVTFESSAGLQKVETFTIINDCTDQSITNPDSSLSISLTSPAAEYNVDYSDRNTDFTFRANRATTDCNLYIRVINEWNFARRKIQNTPRNTPITIDANVASFGTNVNSWKIQCADEENNTGESQDREITYSPSTPTTYTITYDDNGATSGEAPTDPETYLSGATVIVLGTNTMQKEGYTFLNWKNNDTGNSYDEDDTFEITEDTTLYAQWEEDVFFGGSGISGDPYLIATCNQLQNMNLYLSAYYKLVQDIDCSMTESWNDNAGFDPVGTFSGNFDGDGYAINDLYIYRPTENYVGLFANAPATITNVGLIDANITGQSMVGALAGQSATVASNIQNCYSTGVVNGTGNLVGGLIGYKHGPIQQSYSSATVNGYDSVGGLLGYGSAAVTDCYATGDVNGYVNIGGLMGNLASMGNIVNTYSTGNVNGTMSVGGLVGTGGYGSGGFNCTITRSFALGTVTGGPNNGGILGNRSTDGFYTVMVNSYWDTALTNQSNCCFNGNSGCTSTNNQASSYYSTIPFTTLGWSGSTWTEQEDNYPILAWQN